MLLTGLTIASGFSLEVVLLLDADISHLVQQVKTKIECIAVQIASLGTPRVQNNDLFVMQPFCDNLP